MNTWITYDGRAMHVGSMSDAHIKNALACLERRARKLGGKAWLYHVDIEKWNMLQAEAARRNIYAPKAPVPAPAPVCCAAGVTSEEADIVDVAGVPITVYRKKFCGCPLGQSASAAAAQRAALALGIAFTCAALFGSGVGLAVQLW